MGVSIIEKLLEKRSWLLCSGVIYVGLVVVLY